MSHSTGKTNYNAVSNVADSPTDSFLQRYKVLEKIGEGSYSEVLKCKNREKGDIVACKRLKHVYRNWSQVNDIAEITTLRTLARHTNILQMVEIHYDQSLGKVSLVFELMEMNLYELIKDRKRLVQEKRVRFLMFQLMRALRHLHKHGIFHRDIKPENILLKPTNEFEPFQSDLLKLGDLGSVRGLYSRPPYTEYISTRWYRSPECLLTAGYYSFKMDIWAAGCVFYEILTLRPLFPGSSELDQINRIHGIMGPPSHKVLQKFYKQAELEKDTYRNRSQQTRWDIIHTVLDDANSKYEFIEGKSKNFDWYFTGKENGGLERVLPPHISVEARDILKAMLSYDPDNRPTSHRVLQNSYFTDVRETGKEKESKCPIIEIYGDARGKEMISQQCQYVDLKTLGDKKHSKRRREIRYTTLQKKTEVKKIVPKKSSPILKGAASPETPASLTTGTDAISKSLIPLRMPRVEPLQQKYDEKPKEVKKSLVKLPGKFQGDTMTHLEEDKVSIAPSLEKLPIKFETSHATPDTLAAKKRQVLAGNLSPSIFQSTEQTKPTHLATFQADNESLSNKVINHKLTSDEFKKINEARHLVQMEPIGKSGGHKSVKSSIGESPYIKPAAELSLAGKKKVLMQRMKHNSPNANKKRLERLKVDSSTIHVPPQVAAAALKYTSQSAAAARQAREASVELPPKKRSILSEKQPSEDYSIAKTRFGMSRVSGSPEEKTNLEHNLRSIMDQLEKKGNPTKTVKSSNNLTEGSKVKTIPSIPTKSKEIAATTTTTADRSSTNMASIYQTLDLDKQNRLSVRRKEELKKSNDHLKSKISSSLYTKYVASDRSKDSQNNDKDNSKLQSTEAGNPLFPRNRFGFSGPTDASKRKILLSNTSGDKFGQMTKVLPARYDTNMNTFEEKVQEDKKAEGFNKLNQGMLKEFGLHKSKNVGESSNTKNILGLSLPPEPEFKKPPLPPSNKYRRPTHEFKDQPKNETKSVKGGSNSMESTVQNKSLPRDVGDKQRFQKMTKKESLTVIETSEAMKRRSEKIRAHMREDVYCSSDDDIVSTLRQKFDDLISERARRFSDGSSESKILEEDEDGNFSFRSRCERPRKYPRRDSIDTGADISLSTWIGSHAVGQNRSDAKPGVVGDSHKSSDYVEPSRFKNGQSNVRDRHFLEGKAGDRKNRQDLPNKLSASRAYQAKSNTQRHQIYTPPGNKPVYQFVRPEGILLDRKIGHSHNGPIPISNRSNLSRRTEEQKPSRRRLP